MSTKITDTVSVSAPSDNVEAVVSDIATVLRIAAVHPDGFQSGLEAARRNAESLLRRCSGADELEALEALRLRLRELHAAWMTLAILRERL